MHDLFILFLILPQNKSAAQSPESFVYLSIPLVERYNLIRARFLDKTEYAMASMG